MADGENFPLLGNRLLKYGRDPHLRPANSHLLTSRRYPGVINSEVIHEPKPFGYYNILDLKNALKTIRDFRQHMPGFKVTTVVKHQSPCGVGVSDNSYDSFNLAWYAGDKSSMGSMVGYSGEVDLDFVRATRKNKSIGETSSKFIEGLITERFTKEAIESLKKKKTMRVLRCSNLDADMSEHVEREYVFDDLLTQPYNDVLWGHERDEKGNRARERTFEDLGIVTKAKPTVDANHCAFAQITSKHIISNCYIVSRKIEEGRYQTLGLGRGQANRIDALMILAYPYARNYLINEHSQIENDILPYELPGEIISRALGKTALEYADDELAGDNVLANTCSFHPKPDIGEELKAENVRMVDALTNKETGKGVIRNLMNVGGGNEFKDVIGALNEIGVALIATGSDPDYGFFCRSF